VSQAWFGEARELISDEILQVLVLSLLIASACVGWQIQDVLNRCHNAIARPDGHPPSPRIPRFADLEADVVGLAEGG